MDVIYHGSCLDGAFSSFTLYTFLSLLHHKYPTTYPSALSSLLTSFLSRSPIPLSSVLPPSPHPLSPPSQSFFLYSLSQPNRFTSITPGSFSPALINYIRKSSNNAYLCLLDCYGEKTEYIETLCDKYEHVFIIDHHISGKEEWGKVKRENLTVVFDEEMCGFELVMDFLEKWFWFEKMLPEKFYEWLKVFKGYVRKNDLKMNETLESKYFVLGYYHFGYVMSDSNFQLYKQLANLNLEYILDKGKKLYPYHRKKLVELAESASEVEMAYKGRKYRFIGVRSSDQEYTSDLGIILSEIACRKEGFENLAMFYKPGGDVMKVSFRSRRGREGPRALEMAQLFGGGGHLCAAGCQIQKKVFERNFGFKKLGGVEVEDLEGLLFGGGEKEEEKEKEEEVKMI